MVEFSWIILEGLIFFTKRVEASIADFNRKTDVLLSFFFNVSTNFLHKILISIGMSLYGCQLWDVSHIYTNIILWIGVKPFVECLNCIIVLIYVYCTLKLMICLWMVSTFLLRIIKFFNCMYKKIIIWCLSVADWQQTVVVRLCLTVWILYGTCIGLVSQTCLTIHHWTEAAGIFSSPGQGQFSQ